jgi:hypothetical protein
LFCFWNCFWLLYFSFGVVIDWKYKTIILSLF